MPETLPITSTEAPLWRPRNLPVVLLYHIAPSTGPAKSPAAGARTTPACAVTRPLSRSITMAVRNVVPSGLTLMVKSSLPVVPISARP